MVTVRGLSTLNHGPQHVTSLNIMTMTCEP